MNHLAAPSYSHSAAGPCVRREGPNDNEQRNLYGHARAPLLVKPTTTTSTSTAAARGYNNDAPMSRGVTVRAWPAHAPRRCGANGTRSTDGRRGNRRRGREAYWERETESLWPLLAPAGLTWRWTVHFLPETETLTPGETLLSAFGQRERERERGTHRTCCPPGASSCLGSLWMAGGVASDPSFMFVSDLT